MRTKKQGGRYDGYDGLEDRESGINAVAPQQRLSIYISRLILSSSSCLPPTPSGREAVEMLIIPCKQSQAAPFRTNEENDDKHPKSALALHYFILHAQMLNLYL